VIMGLGMGLVMSPMSTAAMNAVDQAKAGVASGVLSMSRMVGGTFGVAIVGALISGLGRSHLQDLLPRASGVQIDRLTGALANGGAGIPGPAGAAVQTAFVDAMNTSLRIGSLVALAGAAVAWLLIADRPEQPQPQRVADDLPHAAPEPTRAVTQPAGA